MLGVSVFLTMGCRWSKSTKEQDSRGVIAKDQPDEHAPPPSDTRGEEKTDVVPMSPAQNLLEDKDDTLEATGTVGEWLNELGLRQYIHAFTSAGYDDLE